MKKPKFVSSADVLGVSPDGQNVSIEMTVALPFVYLDIDVRNVGGLMHAYLEEIDTGDMSKALRYAKYLAQQELEQRDHADPPSVEAAIDEDPTRG